MDAERFAFILEQYPSSLSNRRAVYIDRLLRELPHKTRTEIVSAVQRPSEGHPMLHAQKCLWAEFQS